MWECSACQHGDQCNTSCMSSLRNLALKTRFVKFGGTEVDVILDEID